MSEERFQNDESIVECSQCSAPLVATDQQLTTTAPNDPLSNIEAIPTQSWFHASTHEQWPPVEAAGRDRALHLGTYEAAIDAMYHRMDMMNDADAPFFLHRVTIAPDAVIDPVIHPDGGAPGWGILALTAVTDGGYSVRRYINANEHRGSISLAVALEAISQVQTIAIPVPADQLGIDPAASAAEAALAAVRADAEAQHRAAVAAYDTKEPPPPHPDPIRQRVLEIIGATERSRIDLDRDHQMWAAERRFDAHLRERYLRSAVSAERAEAVGSALQTRARRTGESLHALYRLHAPLMLDPDTVIAALAAREPYRSPVLET